MLRLRNVGVGLAQGRPVPKNVAIIARLAVAGAAFLFLDADFGKGIWQAASRLPELLHLHNNFVAFPTVELIAPQ